jgi:subtilisin family serine protease
LGAWGSTDGTGVGFVDLERGWTLDHEDLAAANISVISGLNQDYTGHGTAVLGEVLGVDNYLGIVGIAPAVTARVVSQWRTASNYQTAAAILSAIGAMRAGDVLLLEAQTTYSTVSGYLPVEVEEAVYDAIRTATDAGIIVIEAGGNGGIDLDTFQDTNGRQILNRASADFRDSGAILVGAGGAFAPHGRLSFSNFGSRIDCYAWGEDIQTTGDGWTGNASNSYTAQFGGTSGATPIVTGAAILLQSWARAQQQAYAPKDIRALLADAGLNTPSADPAVDRIGVMPDLRAIIERETQRLGRVAATAPALADAGKA